jgi:hypothetical protein
VKYAKQGISVKHVASIARLKELWKTTSKKKNHSDVEFEQKFESSTSQIYSYVQSIANIQHQ